MKKTLILITCATLMLAQTHAAIVITEVMSSSAHGGGTNNADWFELTNSGASAVDITDWWWDDDTITTGTTGNFGSVTSIAAGQSVIINGETVGAEASWISDWGLSGVTVVNLGSTLFQNFNATGDQLHIYNTSNAEVTSVTFGAATAGFSLEWDSAGNSLGLSVNGENGAFIAVNNGQTTGNGPGVDVGSPGGAVIPEPGTFAMLLGGVGMLGLLSRRRK